MVMITVVVGEMVLMVVVGEMMLMVVVGGDGDHGVKKEQDSSCNAGKLTKSGLMFQGAEARQCTQPTQEGPSDIRVMGQICDHQYSTQRLGKLLFLLCSLVCAYTAHPSSS